MDPTRMSRSLRRDNLDDRPSPDYASASAPNRSGIQIVYCRTTTGQAGTRNSQTGSDSAASGDERTSVGRWSYLGCPPVGRGGRASLTRGGSRAADSCLRPPPIRIGERDGCGRPRLRRPRTARAEHRAYRPRAVEPPARRIGEIPGRSALDTLERESTDAGARSLTPVAAETLVRPSGPSPTTSATTTVSTHPPP